MKSTWGGGTKKLLPLPQWRQHKSPVDEAKSRLTESLVCLSDIKKKKLNNSTL